MAFVVSRIDSVLQVCNQTLVSEFLKWLYWKACHFNKSLIIISFLNY
jgi:hypothetical protein